MAFLKNTSSYQSENNNGEKIVVKKPIVEYLISSGYAYVYTLIFSIFGLIFLMEIVPNFLKVIFGFVFGSPIVVMLFYRGNKLGERDYKFANKKMLSDIHNANCTKKVSLIKSVLHMLPFVGSSILLTVLSVACKTQWLQGVMAILFIPTTLIFNGLGLFRVEAGFISWYVVLSVTIFVVVVACAFVGGYVKAVIFMRKRERDVVSEIRSFE